MPLSMCAPSASPASSTTVDPISPRTRSAARRPKMIDERRPRRGDRADADALALEATHDLGDRAGAVVDVERELAALGDDTLEPGQVAERGLGGRRVGAVQGERDDVVPGLRLEHLGCPL